MNFGNSMFYFKFPRPGERLRFLEADLTFIRGKPFIVTMWNPTVDSVMEHVLFIPIGLIYLIFLLYCNL